LTVFNGSPRAKKSNSDQLLQRFREGFESTEGNTWEQAYLAQARKCDQHLELFTSAECVLVVFPLYVDAMPSQVMEFFAALAPYAGRPDNPPMMFLVHSGFPEACQSRPVERYCEKLARRLGADYLGTLVKGGSEGIQVMPPWMTRKLYGTMTALGQTFGANRKLDEALVKKLADRERFTGVSLLVARVMMATGFNDFYWNGQLKKNGVWDRRYDQPYARR